MKVVRKIASQVHCKGDVATQQTYRRCYASCHTDLCRDDRLEAKIQRKRRVDNFRESETCKARERAVLEFVDLFYAFPTK